MSRTQTQVRIKSMTLGCYWPSRYFPKERPQWFCIADELRHLAMCEGAPDDIQELISFAEQEATR